MKNGCGNGLKGFWKMKKTWIKNGFGYLDFNLN